MSRTPESAPNASLPLDAKARRKFQDQRRMRFRRAIELYDERRRLQWEIDDYPDHILASSLMSPEAVSRKSARQAY